MRISGILFLLLLSVYAATAQEITFGETEHHFGLIREADGPVFHDFYFMNTGDAPLRIQSVLTTCGCSSSEWSKDPVKPGEKAKIRMIYHPEGRNEKKFTAIAEVYTNSKNFGTHNGVHNLSVSGEVIHEKREVQPEFLLESKEIKPGIRNIEPSVFSMVLKRMQEDLRVQTNIRRNDSLVANVVKTLKRGGMWPDIDYPCYFRTNWEPVTHLGRVLSMARSYTNPDSKYYGNDVLFNAISDALVFWQQSSPKCHNWWFNQISVPQHLGNILVLLEQGEKRLPDDIQTALFGMMAWPDPRKWTGANKLDIALHHLQRGCLLRNDSIVRVAAQQIFYPVRITTAEGIQPDLSYHQHDNQLYIGAYGTVFAEGITQAAAWLQGTDCALQGEQLELFSDFIRNTYLNVFRGGYIDFSVVGRGISRLNALNGRQTVEMLKKLQQLDVKHAGEYADASVRFSTPGQSGYKRTDRNCIYWRSDYALHNSKNFDFSVRTASVRTRKTESGNGENLCGGFLADGATCIRVNGNEYYNIFPVWDWNKIPGVTAPEISTAIATNWGEMGKTVFSGGVSDGKYGTMVFSMDDYGIKANKSWFFFEKEIVCLGAGITSANTNPVVTCINQCLADGEVRTSAGRISPDTKVNGSGKMMDVKWIGHDSVFYFFPEKTKVRLYTGKQSGNWNKINYNYSAELLEKDVFKLWIEHGQNVRDDKYAYVVVPGVTNARDYHDKDIKIEINSAGIQAVYQQKDDVLQVAFYEAGSFSNKKLKLTVDRPCVAIVKGAGGNTPEVLLADPAQKGIEINWKLKSSAYELSGKMKQKTTGWGGNFEIKD